MHQDIEGRSQPQNNANESTPLLGDRSSAPPHKGTGYTVAEDTESDADDEAAVFGLARVSSISQGVEVGPDLESIAPTAVACDVRETPDEGDDYASRFINVSPVRFWLIFSAILLGCVIGFFDSTIMASSHPVITSYFHASNAASWLSTAFLLTCTAFSPLFGRVSDTLGRRPVFLFAIFIFFVATAWCAAAQSIGSFIAARGLCGLGAAGVFSMGMILSSDMVRIEYRGIYQSYINLFLGFGGSMGLAFGGFLCDQVGWRGAFLVQLPFILLYFIIAALTVPADMGLVRPKSERMTLSELIRNVDLTGSCILVVGVTALIMGLNLGGNVYSWSHPIVITSLVAFCVLAVIFISYERHVERAVMPVELLSKNPRAGLIFGNFFGCISVNTVFFNAPLYFQAVKLASPTDSGLRMVMATIAVTGSSVFTGFLITWTKRLKPVVILGGAFLLLGGLAAGSMDIDTPEAVAMTFLSLSSLGQGFSFPSVTVATLATSKQEEQAVVTTTLGLWRNLGSIMGVAISSWIFQNTLLFRLEEMVTEPDKESIVLLVRKSVRAIVALDPMHQRQVIGAYAAALRTTLFSAAIWGAAMLFLHLGVRLPRLGRKA